MQEYESASRNEAEAPAAVLVHIDAYRLQTADELDSIGWHGHGEELRAGAVMAVEWADLVREAMGDDWLEVTLEHADDGRRVILQPHGNWRDRIKRLCASLSAE